MSQTRYASADYAKMTESLDALIPLIDGDPNLSAAHSAYLEQLKQDLSNAQQQVSQPVPQSGQAVQTAAEQPPAGLAPSVAPGVTAMFNTPETLNKVAELLSKAQSGQSIEKVMEEIRSMTGLDKEAFWAELSKLNRKADGNPFVDGGTKGADKKEDKPKEDKPKEDGGEKKVNPFEKKDDKSESDESDDESDDDSDEDKDDKPKADKEPKAPKKSKAPKEPKSEKAPKEEPKKIDKKMVKDLGKVIKLVERLLKKEKGEDEEHRAELEQALDLLKNFLEEERGEHELEGGIDGMDGEMGLEIVAPDIPPALEGLALPLKPENPTMPGVDKIEMEQIPSLPMPMASNPAANVKSGFDVNDRVWRKSDFSAGFETAGDEPGRIIAIGGGKVVVDWGTEDNIPVEENPGDLIIATRTAGEDGVFALPERAGEIELDLDVNMGKGAMGIPEEIEKVLKETSLHELLIKHAQESRQEENIVKHIASGKSCTILERRANGTLLVSVEGKELILWPYEVN